MNFSYRIVRDVEFSMSVRRFNLLSSLSGGLKSIRAKNSPANDIEKAISATASIISAKVEKKTAKSLGMTIVPGAGGFGASPDLVSPNPSGISLVGEIKASIPEFSSYALQKLKTGKSLSASRKGIIGFDRNIKVTSSGVNITKGTARDLNVGFRGSSRLTKSFNNDTVDIFFEEYNQNLGTLKQHLENPSAAKPELKPLIKALRLNLFLKAKSIFIPIAINNSTVLVGNLTFKSSELFSSTNSFVKLSVTNNSIFVNIVFPQTVLNDAFRSASEDIFDSLVQEGMLSSVESFIESKITKNSTQLSKDYSKAVQEAANILKKQKISVGVEFPKGSVIASSIIATYPKKPTQKQAPSILDISLLVRGRARLKMRRGVGEPNPPNIYERSGTFRSSIQAVANIKSNTINYFYLPYYSSLQKYGYDIDGLVEGSIRAIAKERLGGQFILRKNTQPII